MRNHPPCPSTLPAPTTVPVGTVVAGPVVGWQRRDERRTGPTWRQVLLETSRARSIRMRITRIIWALAFVYLGFGLGWTAARPGEHLTEVDIHLVTGALAALIVLIAAEILGRFCVLQPAEPTTELR